MKKIISVIISLLLFMASIKPLADSTIENNNIYNYIIENGTSLGADNLSDNSENNNLPLMANGAEKTINNIVVLIRFKGENEFMNEEKSNQLYNLLNDLNNDKVSI